MSGNNYLKIILFFIFNVYSIQSLNLAALTSNLSSSNLMSFISNYLDVNSTTMATINDLLTGLSSTSNAVIVSKIQDVAENFDESGIISGYNSTFEGPNQLHLGVLNVTALNASLNNMLDASILDKVISKLNSTSVLTGLTAVSGGYNLGSLNMTSLQSSAEAVISLKPNNTILQQISAMYSNVTFADVLNNTAIQLFLSNLSLPQIVIPSPLINVTNISNNLTQNDKLLMYRNWYRDSITKIRQQNMSAVEPGVLRKVMPCYPGPNPLTVSANDSVAGVPPAVISCSELNTTLHEYANASHADAMGIYQNLINSEQVKNGSSVDALLNKLISKLTQLETIASGTNVAPFLKDRISQLEQFRDDLDSDQ